MKTIYYILTTEKEYRCFPMYKEALSEYKRLEGVREHLRLERANDKDGTARVIKSKNNIW